MNKYRYKICIDINVNPYSHYLMLEAFLHANGKITRGLPVATVFLQAADSIK